MQKKIATAAGIWFCMAATLVSPVQAQSAGDILNGIIGNNNGRQQQQPNRRHDEDQRRKQNNAGAAGCAVGGLLGGLLGKRTGDKAALGTALCAVGWSLGVALSKRDRERLTARSHQLLESDGPRSETWTAPDSKARIRLSVGAAEQRETSLPFEVDDGVQTPGRGTRIEARTYVAAQRLDFRTRPGNRAEDIRGYFDRGDRVEVLGRTGDGKWLLVGDGGVLVGYAAASGVKGAQPRRATSRRRAVAKSKPKVIQRAARKGGQTTVVTRNARTAKTRTVSVRASTTCKAVVARTGSKSDTHRGCTLPNGQWAIA